MKELLEQAVQILSQAGGVILVPTETVYGLVCDWEDQLARERIYALKVRDSRKPLAMFADSCNMAENFGVKLNNNARILLEKFAPGPITVIAPGNEFYPTIGVRIPDYDFILQLLKLILLILILMQLWKVLIGSTGQELLLLLVISQLN